MGYTKALSKLERKIVLWSRVKGYLSDLKFIDPSVDANSTTSGNEVVRVGNGGKVLNRVWGVPTSGHGQQ
jgi:hypothetical protein